jgi:hypothetical protein
MRCEAKQKFDLLYDQLKVITEAVVEEKRVLTEEESIRDLEEKQKKRAEQHNELLERQMELRNKWNAVELKHSKVENGIVYVLTNALMPGLVKIGFTAGNPAIRAERLNEQYQLPSRFMVAGYVRTKDPFIVEKQVHSELADFKMSGEFYKIQPEEAMSVIDKYVVT